MTIDAYRHWLGVARRYSRRANEAEDLLQESLLAALQSGRQPLDDAAVGPWFHGVLRNRAALRARTAARERIREASAVLPEDSIENPVHHSPALDWQEIATLPDGLRRVLVLTLSGLDRAEIRQVLAISDTALRQRLRALRKHLGEPRTADFHALAATYAARLERNNPPDGGLRRAALARGPARLAAFRFAVADPDCNLLAIGGKTSQTGEPRQQQDESLPIDGPDETE